MLAKPNRAGSSGAFSRKKIPGVIRRASFIESLEKRLYLTAPLYNWQNVNIGAGGFVDGIFYDSHNQNTLYARTDIGGLYKSTNDGTSWTQLLDFVGNSTANSGNGTQQQEIGVLSFAIDPENSNNLYAMVGQYTGTNGDVLYSTDAGATWNSTPLSFYVGGNSNGRATGERIAVDPYDSNIVLLGSNANGLWESTNAGHSFTQLTGIAASTGINFVYFNPYNGALGSPTQNIFLGVNSTAAGTNIWSTTNAGSTWTEVAGTGSVPNAWMPNRAALASDGNLYLAYTNGLAPTGTITNGGVFRYNTSTGVWANISPDVPQVTNGSGDQFGYVGIALDPNSSTTVVVTSFDRYALGDAIWRTTNANAASPTWTALFDFVGYGGYNPTRNTTAAPWDAAFDDGIGNWAGDVTINPFNSAQIMYGTGQGIWATNNGTSTTTLTAPNSWYFPDTGIEFTAVGDVTASTAGTPLYSAMGDIGGFAHTTLAFSPAAGSAGTGSSNFSDYAGLVPNDAVIIGNGINTNNGAYTTNGSTWTAFSANPGGGTKFNSGTVAISANGSTIVWAPGGRGAYYSSNNGATWTRSTLGASGTLPTGGKIVSDKVNPNYFYYWTENTNDNVMTIYISTDGGHTFNASAGGTLGAGNATLVANQYVAGQLWISSYIGMYESTNFGASFSPMGTTAANITTGNMAIGAPAPGSSLPSIYMYGTLSGSSFEGVYRSDDGGKTWLLLNDVSHQWGGLIQSIAADPNVFGRVYLGINGRGIIMGNPISTLPATWLDQDINEPGNPGWAENSMPLSTGSTSTQWNIVGGGTNISAAPISISSLSRAGGVATAMTTSANGLQVGQTITISGATQSAYDGTFVITGLFNTTAGLGSSIGSATEFTFNIATGSDSATGTISATLADQFNFAYQPTAGNATVSAQLQHLTNADNGSGTPQAGVMYRASNTPTDPFIALVQTSANNLVLEYRTTAGGSVTTQTLGGVPVGSEYMEIVRSGSSFSALYSANGATWTQLGSSISIAAMPATANAGLVASSSFNPQITDATFANVSIAVVNSPIVVNPAAANPNPVTGASTALSALGSENGSGAGLTYTWSYTGPTGVTYTGATNGSNAAQNITANFTQAGSYNFTVTIADAGNNSITSSTAVTVNETAVNVAVSPSTITLPIGSSQPFSTSVTDQFGNTMSTAGITWSITGSFNSIGSTGTAQLGSVAGSYTVTATDGAASGNAAIVAESFAVPSGSTLDINLDGNGPVSLSEFAGTLTASQNGVQISFSAMTQVVVTDTGTADAFNFNGSITQPFVFTSMNQSIVNVNAGALTFAPAAGESISLGLLSIASGASAVITPTITNQPTTLNLTTLAIASTGDLDVTNNVVLINYGGAADPISAIAAWLASGNNAGAWNGAGIISSIAQTHPNYALGYADSADPGDPANLSVHTVEIKYTLLGDADLNGLVNGIDFGIVAANFNQGLTGWDRGDFDYNNIVNGIDFGDVSANFNQGSNIAAATALPATITNSSASTPVTKPVTTKHVIVKKPRHRIR